MKQVYAYALYLLFLFGIACNMSLAQEEWMPDPNLRKVVREKLEIPDDVPLVIPDMQRLYDIVSFDADVESLQGLEHAANLNFLHIGGGRVSDLTPLVRLKNLRILKLHDQRISDISPLAKIKSLEVVHLQSNQINDFTPLLELLNLKEVRVSGNPGDIGQLIGLGLESIKICDVPRSPTTDRIENRSYPSVFGAWHNIINLPMLSSNERLAYHDLYFCCPMFGLFFADTKSGIQLVGDLKGAKEQRNAFLKENPNMVFLVGIYYYGAAPNNYPEDWPYWLKDKLGNQIQDVGWSERLIDFTQPGAQDIFVEQAIAVAKCGIYDGIFFDWWSEEWNVLYNRETNERYRTLAAEIEAKVSMLRRIREAVGNDFLILVNTNRSKVPRSAPYINGTFMETLRDYDGGYTYTGLHEIEDTLYWSEENFREPQINSLEGWGIETQPLDSPENKRWMRVFTTMSLTHSNGYVSLATGIGSTIHKHVYEIWAGHSDEHARGESHDHQHQHYWYDFWDADLGQPIGEKAQLYETPKGITINGLFIREFTDGWAVYNRSGAPQAIQLPEQATGVESGLRNTLHILPDLDGEIYLKSTTDTHDVNADGIVNILDLVAVANAFGKDTPDVNGDGIVNVLDLVQVANRFGE